MYAWRSRSLPSYSVCALAGSAEVPTPNSGGFITGSCDGGEAGAGERLSRLLELGKCEDVVVVVYRWYGGVKLGSDRWKCISGVAKEALTLAGYLGGGEDKGVITKVQLEKKGTKKC